MTSLRRMPLEHRAVADPPERGVVSGGAGGWRACGRHSFAHHGTHSRQGLWKRLVVSAPFRLLCLAFSRLLRMTCACHLLNATTNVLSHVGCSSLFGAKPLTWRQ